jgi:hypothetical protein
VQSERVVGSVHWLRVVNLGVDDFRGRVWAASPLREKAPCYWGSRVALSLQSVNRLVGRGVSVRGT